MVRRPGRDRPDVSAFLALFEHKIRDQSRLSLPEVQAIAAYLSTSVAEFSVFSHADAVLKARALPLPYPTLLKARAHSLRCLCMGKFSTVVWLVVALESFPRLVLQRRLACHGAKACMGWRELVRQVEMEGCGMGAEAERRTWACGKARLRQG